MRIARFFRWLVDSQRELGLLRFEVLVPFTLAVFVAGVSSLTSPPRPILDRDTMLFMEGGRDWGRSVFFYAKASLLVTVNLAAVVAWTRRPSSWSGLLPHFALSVLLTRVFRDGGIYDVDFLNPNGSIGQMVLEMACFGVLGVAVVRALANASWSRRLLGWAAWNVCHVGLFYLFLQFLAHWTWRHSVLVGGSMLVLAVLVWASSPASFSARETVNPGVAGGFSGREMLSLYLIALPFALMGNPFGVGWMAAFCVAIGLVTARLTRWFLGRRASWALAILVTLAIPIIWG